MSSVPSIQRFETDLNSRYSNYSVSKVVNKENGYGYINNLSGLPFEIAEIKASGIVATRQPLPVHMQDRVHVLMCIEGFICIQHCRQEETLNPGELLILDSSEGCVINVSDNHRARTVELRRDQLAYWAFPMKRMAGARIGADTGLSRQIIDLVASMLTRPDVIWPHAHTLQDIIARMLAHCVPAADSTAVYSVSMEELERMERWVKEQLAYAAVTPDHLAAYFGYSRRNLYRMFARAGHTPNSWLLQVKLDNARQLLSQLAGRDGLVANIAYQCGFSDAAHFSRLFKKHYGLSPVEYRRHLLQS